MTDEWRPIGQLGQHRTRRQGDVLLLEIHGEYTLADCQIIYPMLAEMWRENPDVILITDSRNASAIMSADARRFVSEFGRRHFRPEHRSILITTSVVVRAISQMVMALSKMMEPGRPQGTVTFVAKESEAWEVVERMRRERLPASAISLTETLAPSRTSSPSEHV